MSENGDYESVTETDWEAAWRSLLRLEMYSRCAAP